MNEIYLVMSGTGIHTCSSKMMWYSRDRERRMDTPRCHRAWRRVRVTSNLLAVRVLAGVTTAVSRDVDPYEYSVQSIIA